MPVDVRDSLSFCSLDPATAEVSRTGTARIIASSVSVPAGQLFQSVNGSAYFPLAGGGSPGTFDFDMAANTADAFKLHSGASDYFEIDTLVAAPAMRFGEAGVLGLRFSFEVADNDATALRIVEGARTIFTYSTANAAEAMVLGNNTAPPATTILTKNCGVAIADNEANAFYVIQGGDFYYNIAATNTGERHSCNGAGAVGARYSFELLDNIPAAFTVAQGASTYWNISTSNGVEAQGFGGAGPGAAFAFTIPDNIALAFTIAEAANVYFGLVTTNAGERINIGTSAPATTQINFGLAINLPELAGDPGAIAGRVRL